MQVYRGMDIGTAKPDPSARRRVRYRMIDVLEPSAAMTARWFQEVGREALEEELDRCGRVIICGGSGLHFRAIVDPMTFAPTDRDLRSALEEEPHDVLRARLEAADPHCGAVVDLDNPRRVVRALEVLELSGLTPSERARSPEARALAQYRALFPFIGIGMDPGAEAARRIEQRFEMMLDQGFVDEVRSLADELGRTAAQALGYRELLGHVRGEASLDEAVADATAATRAFARRQRTFFTRDPRIAWQPWQDDDGRRLAAAVDEIGERARWSS
jgi:tRNA dimethylallyltransferase